MMKAREWSKIGEIVSGARRRGLSLKEAAKRAGIKVGLLYEYNRRVSEERKGEGGAARSCGRESGEKSGDEAAACQLPAGVQELIRAYRREHSLEGFKRIADVLKQKHLVNVTP